MARKIWLVLAVSALVAGSSVLVVVGPASAGPPSPTVAVNIEKKVVGDDPGVAFPIVLTCTSESEEPLETITAMDADIELNPNDEDSFTVELEDGESETVIVKLPGNLMSLLLVTCEVTEDLKDADLPSGWVCESEITPDEFTLYEVEINGAVSELRVMDIPDEVDVTVTNDCTKPVVTTTTTAAASVPVQPKFTG